MVKESTNCIETNENLLKKADKEQEKTIDVDEYKKKLF